MHSPGGAKITVIEFIEFVGFIGKRDGYVPGSKRTFQAGFQVCAASSAE